MKVNKMVMFMLLENTYSLRLYVRLCWSRFVGVLAFGKQGVTSPKSLIEK